MSVTSTRPDLALVKSRQQKTWASGNFAMVGTKIQIVSEVLVDAVDVRAGWRVLDVACGHGNAAIAAARAGASVLGVDYVPELIADGRVRVAAEGVDVELVEGDAEDLPVEDASFDAAVSVYGTMFAPDHQQTANEMVRATRSGGTLGLASWTPDGFIGEMFRTIGAHVPPPPGVASPLLWGREDHLRDLFGEAVATMRSTEQTFTFRFRSADEFVTFFRRWYGPTYKAFEALDDSATEELRADLTALAARWDRHGDGGSVAIPSSYLQTVIGLR